MTETRWQRLGGVCGVLYVAVVVATFFMPTTPDADEPTAAIAQAIAEDRTGHIAGVYLGGIAVVLFVLFVAALASLRRGSASSAPWWRPGARSRLVRSLPAPCRSRSCSPRTRGANRPPSALCSSSTSS